MRRKTTLVSISAWSQLIIWTLVVTTFALATFPPDTQAMLAPAISPAADSAARSADLRAVQNVLETKMVRARLGDLGLTSEEINARLSQLSDNELHQLATQLDGLMPGGDGGLGIVIAVLVIAILVLLFVFLVKRV
jgi:hypothetical protein